MSAPLRTVRIRKRASCAQEAQRQIRIVRSKRLDYLAPELVCGLKTLVIRLITLVDVRDKFLDALDCLLHQFRRAFFISGPKHLRGFYLECGACLRAAQLWKVLSCFAEQSQAFGFGDILTFYRLQLLLSCLSDFDYLDFVTSRRI